MKRISEEIIASCIKIHKALGPGLLESVYQKCMRYELQNKNFNVESEVMIPVSYEELNCSSGFRADIIVNRKVIVEIKSVEKILPVHRAQTLTYLKLSKYPLALLVNFGEVLVKDGIHRFVNGEEGNTL